MVFRTSRLSIVNVSSSGALESTDPLVHCLTLQRDPDSVSVHDFVSLKCPIQDNATMGAFCDVRKTHETSVGGHFWISIVVVPEKYFWNIILLHHLHPHQHHHYRRLHDKIFNLYWVQSFINTLGKLCACFSYGRPRNA